MQETNLLNNLLEFEKNYNQMNTLKKDKKCFFLYKIKLKGKCY